APGRVRLRHEHITVRKDVEPSGMVQAAREGMDRETIGRSRRRVVGPTFGLGDIYDGNQRLLWRRQHGTETRSGGNRKSGRTAARHSRQGRPDTQTRAHKILPHHVLAAQESSECSHQDSICTITRRERHPARGERALPVDTGEIALTGKTSVARRRPRR
ncbi:MAG: hypothetical protein QOK07_2844, partial [Gemmatimonadaceae bacterium]|nr:hypothetical protein [Gemmatimonadaceae bacterium]